MPQQFQLQDAPLDVELENWQRSYPKIPPSDRLPKIVTLEKIKQPDSQRLDTSLSQDPTNLDFSLDYGRIQHSSPL